MAQQTPYIGSKISLISKLDIRYEGILYTVDTNESTIALAKVRSFGTENRPTVNPVAGRDDVYEYIIFKATDIKDLLICETPKPMPQLSGGLPYDPAILTVSSGRIIPTQSGNASALINNVLSAGSSHSGTPRASPGHDLMNSRAPGAGRMQRPGPTSNAIQQLTGNRGLSNYQQRQQQLPQGLGRIFGSQQQSAIFPQITNNQQGYNYQGGQQGGRGPRSNSYYSRGGGNFQRGGNKGGSAGKLQPAKEKLKFESDYDFEKANEQFQETLNHIVLDLKKIKVEDSEGRKSGFSDESSDIVEVDGTNPEEDDDDEATVKYYDKSSSFFDRISCEALEKQEGKPRTDWRKERETNQETFGHSAVRSLAYKRARGYLGGRGGRGTFNGYRYGYNNYGGVQRGYGNVRNNRRGGYRNTFSAQ